MKEAAKLIRFVESSFLSPLLTEEGLTDISYNGAELFYRSNQCGSKKAEMDLGKEEVGDFLRQIANLAEKQFSYLNPILDVSFGKYRLNATFSSLTRVRNENSYSFSLRLAGETSLLEDDPGFFGGKSKKIILDALSKRESIVISGLTGAGKTELQKYMLLHLPEAMRIIVIDNVEELEMIRNDGQLDLTTWLVDERVKEASYASLIKNALRNRPDYLLLAEARGGEMLEALHCAMSGHPILLTLHAKSAITVPHRIARLAMMAGERILYEDALEDAFDHLDLIVHVEAKQEKGRIKRFIKEIGRIDSQNKRVELIYERGKA